MRHYLNAASTELNHGWEFALTWAGAWPKPDGIDPSYWSPATVPGTVAKALSAANRFDPEKPEPLQGLDAWYRCRLSEPAGPAVLRFDGLATLAEVFFNGELVLRSESMFEAAEVAVSLTGDDELAIRFIALTQALSAKAKRAKWRPQLFDDQGLRLVRTTLLGHMPGWCPSIQAVGPYRQISLIRPESRILDQLRISAELTTEGEGVLSVSCTGDGHGLTIICGQVSAPLVAEGDRFSAILRIPAVQAWWPATHGSPTLYDVEVSDGQSTTTLSRTGFRRLKIEDGHGEDFAVTINGEPIFCRGAVWTSADLLGLSADRASYEELLYQLAAAGANMVRIPGITTYESDAFYQLCDELGLLVFQDFMFANFDYPNDDAFVDRVRTEVRQFLSRRQGSPSLAILSAGSEIAQQASMLGLAEQHWYSQLATEVLPQLVTELRPDVAYVPGSPSGGALPFSVDAGIGHYYGVGAYERGLEDARRAKVRFTSECLAFANVPAQTNLTPKLSATPVHDPAWKAGVPRDPGASWDFEDTRDHYLNRLYGLDPAALRRADPGQYLALSRAVTTEVVTETFAEWRSTESSCHGALVFTLADLRPGAGWGVLDSDHRPKPVFYGLARAWREITVVFTDEGTNGLRLHVINETSQPVVATAEIFGLRDGVVPVSAASREVELLPRSTTPINATDLLGGFFDYNYAYRFGAASHQVTVARLRVSGAIVAEAFAFPLGRGAARYPSQLQAALVGDSLPWTLQISTDSFAQSVHIDCPGFTCADDWFHLAPGEARTISLKPLANTDPQARPSGEVRSLDGTPARF